MPDCREIRQILQDFLSYRQLSRTERDSSCPSLVAPEVPDCLCESDQLARGTGIRTCYYSCPVANRQAELSK